MEPAMSDVNDVNDVDTCKGKSRGSVDTRTGKGNIVIGVMLVVTGVAVILDRAGVWHLANQWTLWPIILGGIGLARFLQSVPGEPKQGLLFLTAAVWLFLAEAGWVSLGDSWPIVIIVLGIIVALNGGTRRRRWHPPSPPGAPPRPAHVRGPRRPDYPLSPLAVLGIWIALVVGLQVSGLRSFSDASESDRVSVVSVMGRSEHTSRATPFQGANVTNVMGRSELDLSQATLTPGANATVQVFSAVGTVVLRVPSTWTVDTGAISAFGGVRDDRATPAEAEAPVGPAPRLVLRGLVVFGRLTITS
jgi:hypothetical protein